MADGYEIFTGNTDKDFSKYQKIIRDLRLCVKLIDIVNGTDVAYKAAYNSETHSYDKKELKRVNMRNNHRFIPPILQQIYDTNKNLDMTIANEVRRMKAWSLYNQIRALNINRWI